MDDSSSQSESQQPSDTDGPTPDFNPEDSTAEESDNTPSGRKPPVLPPRLQSPNSSKNAAASQEEDEEDFLVLNYNHPLISRFTSALSQQLHNQLERISLALKEKLEAEKAVDSHKNAVGVKMFKLRAQLDKRQKKLEAEQQLREETEAKRQQAQMQLKEMKDKYSKLTVLNTQAKLKASRIQAELDKQMQDLFFTQEASEELFSQIKTMNSIKQRVGVKKSHAEEELLRQDLYLNYLTKEVFKLTDESTMYELYAKAQAEETLTGKEALFEAEEDMELLLIKHKQLLQQWNNSLKAIGKQCEALNDMKDAANLVKKKALLLKSEIESYKKLNNQAQEQNEKLTMQLNWCEMDCAGMEKQINQKRAKIEITQSHYGVCLRSLDETIQNFNNLTKQSHKYETEMKDQRKHLEQECTRRLDLEDKIATKIQQKITNDRAAKYFEQLNNKLMAVKREKMLQMQQLENDLMSMKLESQNMDRSLNDMIHNHKVLQDKINNYNKLLTMNQNELTLCVQLIEKNWGAINTCNNKIAQVLRETKGEDLSPLQIIIQKLKSEIDNVETEIKEHRLLWMKQQNTMVEMSHDNEDKNRRIRKLQTENTGLEQRSIRLECQINVNNREAGELEEGLNKQRRELLKTISLLTRNEHMSQVVEQENALMEMDFITTLKEAEWESISMQMMLEKMQEEKEILVNSLTEAERRIMLWEKKSQVLRETHLALNSTEESEENQRVKDEIHQLELRIIQLKRQQERLIRESEAIVDKRENIVLRRENLSNTPSKPGTETELQRCNKILQSKYQDMQKRLAECERTLKELQKNRESLSEEVEKEKEQVTQLLLDNNIVDSQLANLQDTKESNAVRLVSLQGRNKKLHLASAGNYKVSSTSETVDNALREHLSNVQDMSDIVSSVCEEYPRYRGALGRLTHLLAAYKKEPQAEG